MSMYQYIFWKDNFPQSSCVLEQNAKQIQLHLFANEKGWRSSLSKQEKCENISETQTFFGVGAKCTICKPNVVMLLLLLLYVKHNMENICC